MGGMYEGGGVGTFFQFRGVGRCWWWGGGGGGGLVGGGR